MFAPADIQDDLTLRVPQFFCCNCGNAEDLRTHSTPLAPVHFTIVGSQAIWLDLPYCRRCIGTATRRPVSVVKKTTVALLTGMVVGLLAMVAPLPPLPAPIGESLFFFIAAALGFALVFGLYAVQKPRGTQTTYYQPVRLAKLERKFSGQIVALTLQFTHARYAEAFASANREAVDRGVLRVEHVAAPR